MVDTAAMSEPVRARFKRPERDSLFLAAQVRSMGREQTVRLRNLSEDGAMIQGQLNLRPGQRAFVHVRNRGWVEGKIAWVKPSCCGLTFAAPIDPKTARTPV
jgi:hypothetical protein